MPQYRNPFEKGDLYVKFDVQFPDNNWISPEKLVVGHVTLLIINCILTNIQNSYWSERVLHTLPVSITILCICRDM